MRTLRTDPEPRRERECEPGGEGSPALREIVEICCPLFEPTPSCFGEMTGFSLDLLTRFGWVTSIYSPWTQCTGWLTRILLGAGRYSSIILLYTGTLEERQSSHDRVDAFQYSLDGRVRNTDSKLGSRLHLSFASCLLRPPEHSPAVTDDIFFSLNLHAWKRSCYYSRELPVRSR